MYLGERTTLGGCYFCCGVSGKEERSADNTCQLETTVSERLTYAFEAKVKAIALFEE
jgi:hypothetical protein